MAERLNAAVLKTVGRASVPGVRIPLSPPSPEHASPRPVRPAGGSLFAAGLAAGLAVAAGATLPPYPRPPSARATVVFARARTVRAPSPSAALTFLTKR